MIILNENIIDSQRILLQSWGMHVRQIGYEIGRKGMKPRRVNQSIVQQRCNKSLAAC